MRNNLGGDIHVDFMVGIKANFLIGRLFATVIVLLGNGRGHLLISMHMQVWLGVLGGQEKIDGDRIGR